MSSTILHDPVEDLRAQARVGGWPVAFDPTLTFDRSGLKRFVELWESKRDGKALPRRRDFSARELKSTLSRIMLFEKVEGPRYRIRLMGTGLVQVWGDMTGKFVDEALPPRLQPRWKGMIEATLALGRPLRIVARVEFLEKTFLVAEIASVPLCDDSGRPVLVMAAIHASSERPWEEVGRLLQTG